MFLNCPRCGARDLRLSQHQTAWELVKHWFGVYPLRCRQCRYRWEARIGPRWGYARCPRCYRQDLTTWDPRNYRLSRWTALLLFFRAQRYRCEPCRWNFVSFLPRAERLGSKPGAEPARRTGTDGN